jgi:DNA-binding Lrp family transcriptional regulator
MSKRDIYKILLNTLENPTKLGILMLLTHKHKMTVTQMSKLIKVSKANLYHFVGQMVKDGLLSKPEALIKKNYVEKYYRLDEKFFEALDPSEQRKRLKAARPEELKTILQSTFVSLGLDFRLMAEEIARADDKTLKQIAKSVSDERTTISYSILSDKAYEYVLAELKRINKTTMEAEGREKPSLQGNRVILVGLPRFGTEES